MDKKELKGIIKQLVRESLMEIFVEMKLETIVENVIKKQQPITRQINESVVAKNPVVQSTQVDTGKEQLRKFIREQVAPDNSDMADIYKDILDRGSPILEDDNNAQPELVSEQALKNSGLIRDNWDKFGI